MNPTFAAVLAWWRTRHVYLRALLLALGLLVLVLYMPLWLWVALPMLVFACFVGGMVSALLEIALERRAARRAAKVPA